MTLAHITDYETRGPEQLTDRYRKPAIIALLRSWLAELQEVEDALWALLTERAVANAVGLQLDVLGRILGQPREGRSDEVYRTWVAARVLVLRSSGQTEQLIAIAKRLLGTVPIHLEEYPPLAMMMRADAPIDPELGASIARMLSAAKGGGVALQFEWFAPGLAQPFTLGAVSELNSPMGLDRGVLAAVSNGNEVVFFVPQPANLLKGLRVELDPNDAQVSGGLVTQFNNTNGVGGPCVQATPANQAALAAADPDFNNQPSVVFSGSGSDVASAKWYDLPNLSALTQGEAFVVLKPDYSYTNATPPTPGHTGLWEIGTGGPTLYNYYGGASYEAFGTNAQKAIGVGPVNHAHIYSVSSAAGSYKAYRTPRGLLYNGSSNTVGFRATPRFGRSSTNSYFNGRLAYLAICDQVQTPEAREAMFQYLSTRFGIAVPLLPADILNGLVVELDPNDVVTSGSLVTSFNNTNGIGGPCVQATAANQATLVATDTNFNNQPVVQFSGSSAVDGKFYNLPNLSALTQGEVFVVLKTDYCYPSPPAPSANHQCLWSTGTGSSFYNNSNNKLYECFGKSSNAAPAPTVWGLNTPHVYNVRSAPNAYAIWMSHAGMVLSNSENIVAFPAAPRFGYSSYNNGAFNGRLAYLAICDQVQTPEARAAMLQYLSTRFGIALP